MQSTEKIAISSALLCMLLCQIVVAQTEPTVTVRPIDSPRHSVLVILDGKLVELESAQIQRGLQVMVWLRDLEKLGWGTVESSSPERVTFRGKGVTLTFTKGQGIALINSLAVNLPINVYLREGKLMVPLSFVAKALGFDYQCIERPVVTITTELTKSVAKRTNTLQGTVTYNGSGIEGVIVRAVGPDFTVIKNAVARTDPNGEYKIEGLADGTYLAYVYTCL
ncbi:MAG: stalk domain-containing protein, partial [Armatimonadetes bacterium]|nr:stalk domain-containing protein [Armatimonadota bacterium]